MTCFQIACAESSGSLSLAGVSGVVTVAGVAAAGVDGTEGGVLAGAVVVPASGVALFAVEGVVSADGSVAASPFFFLVFFTFLGFGSADAVEEVSAAVTAGAPDSATECSRRTMTCS